ncbi:MAG TPA: hypothetical protein VFQ38_10000 [Longimicrobiales bacterium]|nr:hypothetical protein [Longimicrobiales bacterium]
MPAGYSGTPLARKLGIRAGATVAVDGAPPHYWELLPDLPAVVRAGPEDAPVDFLHAFVRERAELARRLPALRARLHPEGMLWVSWPKKASGVATDVTEDVVRELALANGLVDVKVCAVDDVWSGLKLVYRVADRGRGGAGKRAAEANVAEKASEEQHNRIGDAAVRAKTGKAWREWFEILDAAGAATLSHRDIALLLHEAHGVDGWWAQMVTVGYEQARGRREKHQTSDGYNANASKTIAVPLARLWTAWDDDGERRAWLGAPAATRTSSTPEKVLRLAWEDGRSRVEVRFTAKGDAKSQVAVDHTRLSSAQEVAALKAYWGEALNRLKSKLETG